MELRAGSGPPLCLLLAAGALAACPRTNLSEPWVYPEPVLDPVSHHHYDDLRRTYPESPRPLDSPQGAVPYLREGGHCTSHAECIVVRPIAGLPHVPDPSKERCGHRCYVALHASLEPAWEAARGRLDLKVPCDRPPLRCPPIHEYTALCFEAQCGLLPAQLLTSDPPPSSR